MSQKKDETYIPFNIDKILREITALELYKLGSDVHVTQIPCDCVFTMRREKIPCVDYLLS